MKTIEKFIDLMDSELSVIERLWMTYDGYIREEYESAMSDQFYYLFFVDQYEEAIKELTSEELNCYSNLRQFKMELV